jgi:hypothetical protein
MLFLVRNPPHPIVTCSVVLFDDPEMLASGHETELLDNEMGEGTSCQSNANGNEGGAQIGSDYLMSENIQPDVTS